MKAPVTALLGALAAATGYLSQLVYAQSDPFIEEIKRKAVARETDDGFCRRAPWVTTDPQGEHMFLERSYPGFSEAARFASGACSYTHVTDTWQGQYGKCVRYTWWACQPGLTCSLGESQFCMGPDGRYLRQ